MTKEEQQTIIKEAMVRNLRKHDDIPEDIGLIYQNWVLSKIQQASSQLIQQTEPAQAPQPQQEAS